MMPSLTGTERMSDLISNLIYDVGLHRGEDTDFYLKMGFGVVAVEANPELIAQCKILLSRRHRVQTFAHH